MKKQIMTMITALLLAAPVAQGMQQDKATERWYDIPLLPKTVIAVIEDAVQVILGNKLLSDIPNTTAQQAQIQEVISYWIADQKTPDSLSDTRLQAIVTDINRQLKVTLLQNAERAFDLNAGDIPEKEAFGTDPLAPILHQDRQSRPTKQSPSPINKLGQKCAEELGFLTNMALKATE